MQKQSQKRIIIKNLKTDINPHEEQQYSKEKPITYNTYNNYHI